MKDIPPSRGGGKVSLESNSGGVNETDLIEDIDLEDICEVVLSLKCKQCDFLCNDKITLALHVKNSHSRDSGSKSISHGKRNKNTAAVEDQQQQLVVQDADIYSSLSEGKFAKPTSKTSSRKSSRKQKLCDPQPEAFTLPSTNGADGNHTNLSGPTTEAILDESVEDVFLCAECDIVFSSREVCCSHMHKVHGLNQFSTDFIQEEIISKPTKNLPCTKNRKIKLPKQFTPDAGAIVPKKYRVTKDIFHACSKCSIKFESVEVVMFHEQCHVPAHKESETETTSKESGNGASSSGFPKTAKRYQCPVCESKGSGSQIFSKWGACAWHLWKEHRIDCELYTCTICKQFKSHLVARVKDHEQLHSTKSSYKCKTCNKTFKQMKQLRCHEKYHKDNSTKLPPPSDSRWYTPKECPVCKRVLSDSKCLKKHISAVHNKLKPYVCNICGHTSARKAELQLHVRQHTGEKPYKCPMCSFQTGDHNSLRKHKLRHSDERPYACPYCDYRCIQSCAFKKHIVACHPGQEVVFLCQLCSHASVNETVFAAHQKDHADGLSSNSPECSSNLETATSKDINGDEELVDYWSGSGDDSIDIIDNGGVTIPASPLTASTSQKANTSEETSASKRGEWKKITASSSSSSSFGFQKDNKPVGESGHRKSNSGYHESRRHPSTSFTGLKVDNGIEKETAVDIISKRKPSVNGDVQERPRTPQIFCVTASLQPVSSPRHAASISITPHQDIRGSDDTESSSEVITNPHKLIENIQLTPLDLTDIIECNEQSNDDGMLQKLLDMSGV